MPSVAVLMGSDFGTLILSAYRIPCRIADDVATAPDCGGAHLPGVVAPQMPLSVIGVRELQKKLAGAVLENDARAQEQFAGRRP